MQSASRIKRVKLIGIVIIGGASLLAVAALLAANMQAKEQDSVAPSLGPYGSISTYCGKKGLPRNITNIPWIGCFYLSAGHTATGTLSNQHVEVTVDATGNELFTVNGTVVTNIGGPQRPESGTNVPVARVGGVAGYWICQDASRASCSADITIFGRYPDKSVLFMVSECLPPTHHICVLDQENWDFEMARLSKAR